MLLSAAGFVLWASLAANPTPLAFAALRDDETMHVQDDRYLVFEPQMAGTVTASSTNQSSASLPQGLIFYPGARVDYRAYALAVREIAKAGFVCVIVPMPLNLAFFGSNKATEVIKKFPTIKKWTIAGHSLGGAMAAQFLADNPRSGISGLILWGAFSATDISKDGNIRVLSLSASQDGLSTPPKIKSYAKNLPGFSRFLEIQGGNHAQFGAYGDQDGDKAATISPAEQRRQTVDATIAFLKDLP